MKKNYFLSLQKKSFCKYSILAFLFSFFIGNNAFGQATSVFLAGNYNSWSTSNNPMVRIGSSFDFEYYVTFGSSGNLKFVESGTPWYGENIAYSAGLMKITYNSSSHLYNISSITGVGRNYGNETATSSGTQGGTYYLGDQFPKYNFYTSSGWGTETDIQVGYGTSSYLTYTNADWEGDRGNARLVKKDAGFGNFSSTGTWYFVGKYITGGNTYYNDETSWTSDTSLIIPGNATSYSVSALSPPSAQAASAASWTSINLNWTKWNSKNVMVVRSTTNSFTAPAQGQHYAVNDMIGSGTVVYNNNATSTTDTGLQPNTTYYYAFYSENYSYYSSAVTTSAKTTSSDNNGAPTVLYTSLTTTTPSPSNSRYDLIDYGKYRQIQFQANQSTASGATEWAFSKGIASAPDYGVNWRPYNGTTVNPISFNSLLLTNNPNGAKYNSTSQGVDGKLPAITSGRFYTFNVTEAINEDNRMKVLETTYNPVDLVSVSSPNTFTGEITINTSADPSAGEYVYARYTSDNWNTSKIIACNFTENVGKVYLPVCVVSGTTINYYFYSSNEAKADIDNEIATNNYTGSAQDAVHDLSTLKILNANGANYSFTFGSGTVTWNGSNWSDALTDNNNLIFDGTYSGPGVKGCNCKVNTGKNVTITSGTLALQNEVTVDGTLTFENNTSLVQLNNVTNVGNITYKRNTQAALNAYDYVYWSSPVSGQVVPSGQNYYWNNATANGNGTYGNWSSAVGQTMGKGTGYIMKNIASTNFYGVPFNGDVSVTVNRQNLTGFNDNFNLIGNPYPSAINALEFLADNDNTAIEGSVALWTHGTGLSSANADPFYQNYDSNYSENDYIVYNGLGSQTGPSAAGTFNGNIAAGQAFFVHMVDGAISSSTIKFKNSMRTNANSDAYGNSQFYRTNSAMATSITTPEDAEKHRIWLDIVDANQVASRTMVGYVANATADKDRLYDAVSTTDSSVMHSYSLIGTDKMIIQAKGLPFDDQDTFQIGFNAPQAGTYNMAIFAVDGLFENQNIYLEDTLLNVIHDIKVAPYPFTAATAGLNDSRFILRFTNAALGNPDFDAVESVIVSTQTKQITINSALENIKSVVVYDLLGRELINKKDLNQTQVVLNAVMATQTLIVKTTLENGQVATRKVVIK